MPLTEVRVFPPDSLVQLIFEAPQNKLTEQSGIERKTEFGRTTGFAEGKNFCGRRNKE